MSETLDKKAVVREAYGKLAVAGAGSSSGLPEIPSEAIGYAAEDLTAVPEGANLGLGCGNPLALAALQPGETVLDLGSGGGFDCFLSANAVGPTGHVIGVDMTPEMIDRARRNADQGGYTNVEFRLGDIEVLPVEEGAVDAIISNCVINLAPDKPMAFAEAFRVLKPGGRMHVSDLVLSGEAPPELLASAAAYVSCVGGAATYDDYLGMIRQAGFTEVTVLSDRDATELLSSSCCTPVDEAAPGCGCSSAAVSLTAGLVRSINVMARKPG